MLAISKKKKKKPLKKKGTNRGDIDLGVLSGV